MLRLATTTPLPTRDLGGGSLSLQPSRSPPNRTPPVPSPRGLMGLGEGRLVAGLRVVRGKAGVARVLCTSTSPHPGAPSCCPSWGGGWGDGCAGLPFPRVGRAHNPQELVLVCIAREGTWEWYWSLEGTQRPSLGWSSVRSGLEREKIFGILFFFFLFFFFLMNTLRRRSRGSQGDLIFQDLRSSIKQNKLSSFKVNDG